MRKIIIVSIIFVIYSCSSKPFTTSGVLINNEDIKISEFAEGIPNPLKIDVNFIKDKILVMGMSSLRIIEKEDIKSSKYLKYEINTWQPSLIKVNAKIYIVAGGGGFSDIGLMNDMGKLLWKYMPDPKLHPFAMEGGDLNKDGIPEFYVGNYDGLHILDMKGGLIKKIGPFWIHDVKIGKYNSEDIVIGLDRNVFYYWDYNGRLIKKIYVKGNFSRFEIVNWPEKNNLLTSDGDYVYVLDLDGNIVFKKEIGINIFAINGVGIKFNQFDKRYFAAVADYSTKYNRSLLCIFSPSGDLIFRDVLNRTQAIAAVNRNDGKSQYLLVGDFPKMKKYELE